MKIFMSRRIVLVIVLFFLFQNFVVSLFAQNDSTSAWKWNYDAKPSFLKPANKTKSKVFLPAMPTKDDYAKNRIDVEFAYCEDSVKMLSVFLKPIIIPKELNKHLIAFRNPKEQPIIMLPNFITNQPEICEDGFIVSWSNDQFSFFYLDTAKCVVFGVNVNPKYYTPDSDYEILRRFLNESFTLTFDIDEFFLDEKVFSKKPLEVSAHYKRPIMENERNKKTPWGLSGNFTLFSENFTTVFFRCDKNIPDDIDLETQSRFSKLVTMENLVPVSVKRREEEKRTNNPPLPPPPPINTPLLAKTHKTNETNTKNETEKLAQTESGRLKLMDSLVDKTMWKEYKNFARIAIGNYYLNNNSKQISTQESNKIKELLQSNDAEIRAHGITFLAFARVHDAAQILENIFETETNITNQESIIHKLSDIGDKRSLKFLTTIQSNETLKPTLRKITRQAITKIENK
jgi:hypothetical protein